MKIAIVGSGISGLVAASRLHNAHEISVFEANDYVGGHTNTVDIELEGRSYLIDTGFIVFNDRTYPNFCRLMQQLGVASRPTSMSFSVQAGQSGLEYNGTSLAGVFAQKRNLLRPSFYRMLRDILRFNREAPEVLAVDGDDRDATVADFLQANGYSQEFAEHYLLPMGAAIWSCPTATFAEFPIRFIVEFYWNHGLLSLKDRPTWRVVEGGSHSYVRALTVPFQNRIRLNCPVRSVKRYQDRVEVETKEGVEQFDEIVFACHSDQALQLLGGDVCDTERGVLLQIPYEENTAVLHTDQAMLPKRRRAWASWNYRVTASGTESDAHATLTYYMNMLQHIESPHTFCVTLNQQERIDPAKVLGVYRYSHPVFTVNRSAAQRRHNELIRRNRTSFCGAYWGNGFHEDGVKSALAVVAAFEHEPVPEVSHA